MNAHVYALRVENILRSVFSSEKRGSVVLIDADYIESNLYVSVAYGLGYLYSKADPFKQAEIEKFIHEYDYYLNFGIGGLLLFVTNMQEINNGSYSINFDNGEKALEAIISALYALCE